MEKEEVISQLNFLAQEKEKLERVLKHEEGRNYKKYATLLQAYLTISGNVSQLKSFKKQIEENEKEEAEREKIIADAMTEQETSDMTEAEV